jgi:hypothetical protein
MDIRTGVLAGYLTEKQLAAELGLTERTLARWRERRIGPPVTMVGRVPQYSIEAARAWLAAGGTRAATTREQRRRKKD